jgi:hypothetical protein
MRTAPGTYRLFHQGAWRARPEDASKPYTGTSREFSVTDASAGTCPAGVGSDYDMSPAGVSARTE